MGGWSEGDREDVSSKLDGPEGATGTKILVSLVTTRFLTFRVTWVRNTTSHLLEKMFSRIVQDTRLAAFLDFLLRWCPCVATMGHFGRDRVGALGEGEVGEGDDVATWTLK